MQDRLPDVYEITRPAGLAGPFVFDSPHSGTIYPPDFGYACSTKLLHKAEDTRVDDLFAAAPLHGAPLLCALFPRTYIDVNRTETDIDPSILAEAWPGLLARDGRSSAGHGLIRRLLRPGFPIYDRKLGVAEIQNRLEKYYVPYHTALRTLLDETYAAHGQVWHINCHSMPSTSAYASPGAVFRPLEGNRVDMVLGTRDGTTCDPVFAQEVKSYLTNLGYRVSLNNPYKGVELLRRYAQPTRNRHSLQIELSKALYLDEEANEIHKGYETLKAHLDALIVFMRDYVAQMKIPAAAD